jgi:UDP-N-acetylmuramoyl-tripeptide--D-alanyl-D-alanine ligase
MELGMNHAGEIRVLVGLSEPDVRVWTNVGDAHIGNFGDADGIAAAKAEILDGAGPATVLVANADDPRVMRYTSGFAGRLVTFGYGETASVRATSVEDRGLSGTVATFAAGADQVTVRVPLLGRGNLSNVLCAAAVATTMGVPLSDVAARAERLTPAKRRGEVRHLRQGVTVVDDSYNSSPSALNKSLEMLAREPVVGRRVAVLGEMLELGDFATSLHEACGTTAARAGLELLITVGGAAAAALGRAAIGAGMEAVAVRHVATSIEAADLVARLVAPGDVVLVKGSRGVKTDLVVDRLAAELG